jgi:hypothetical protein
LDKGTADLLDLVGVVADRFSWVNDFDIPAITRAICIFQPKRTLLQAVPLPEMLFSMADAANPFRILCSRTAVSIPVGHPDDTRSGNPGCSHDGKLQLPLTGVAGSDVAQNLPQNGTRFLMTGIFYQPVPT